MDWGGIFTDVLQKLPHKPFADVGKYCHWHNIVFIQDLFVKTGKKTCLWLFKIFFTRLDLPWEFDSPLSGDSLKNTGGKSKVFSIFYFLPIYPSADQT